MKKIKKERNIYGNPRPNTLMNENDEGLIKLLIDERIKTITTQTHI
jgi:hypothetical protein